MQTGEISFTTIHKTRKKSEAATNKKIRSMRGHDAITLRKKVIVLQLCL